MYFRIVVPPPLRSGWEVSHAIQTFHEASELFDEHEAFTVAESILENIPCKSPSQAAGLEGSLSKCKSADLDVDIGIPIASSEPNTRLRRLRPVHDGTDNWLIDLGQLFTEQAAEAFEGEAFLYMQSWCIDHQRRPNCRGPRPIRLNSHSVTWIDDFKHELCDLLDLNVFFSIYGAKPRPPQFRHCNYACHVLLEQNRHRGQAAGILTALVSGHTRDGIIQGAFSTSRFLRQPDQIDLLEVETFCTGRHCTERIMTWSPSIL